MKEKQMESNTDTQQKAQMIPHLFLILRLPTDQSDNKVRIKIDCSLLRLFSDFLHGIDFSKISELESVRQAFHLWADLQSTAKIDPKKLVTALRALKKWQHLPLLVRHQNACLLLSVPSLGTEETAENREYSPNSFELTSERSKGAVISTFPASLPDNETLDSLKTPTFVYPTTSVRVAFSSLLQSDCLAEQISYLDEHTIEETNTSNNTVWNIIYVINFFLIT